MPLDATVPAAPATAPRARRWRTAPGWCGALALVAAAAWVGHELALHTGLARLQEAAEHRLDMLATRLDADLARFDYLPQLLQMTPVVPALLQAPSDTALRDAVSRYLNGVNATVGAEMLYVLDPAGVSIAASDWNRPETTVGQDLSFRPYVRDALAYGRGRFYGIGVTSRKPGYYLSYALRRGAQLRGVVTAKVDIAAAEGDWRRLPGHVVLLDEHGVVILSSREDLKFRPQAPLGEAERAEVQRSRPYGSAPLQPLDWHAAQDLGARSQIVLLDGRSNLASTRRLQRAPWRLVVLDELTPVRMAARYAAFTASLAMAVLLLIGVAVWQRQRAVRAKLASRAALQAAHDNLESTVAARTAQLRAAQNELVHAGKMAALGQMSAGMVHELNQPLTALRTLSESAGMLLEQHRPEEVRNNLRRIEGTVDRLARLTSKLKTFAHRSDAPWVSLPLSRAIADARAIVGAALTEHAIDVEVDIRPPTLALVTQEEALASVLVNVMRNAIDAMADAPTRTLAVAAREHPGGVTLTISDSGSGIRADILPRLFEPFVTSKPAGAGLGLGLVISAQQVRALGGTLRAANRPEGGACFILELPLAPPAE